MKFKVSLRLIFIWLMIFTWKLLKWYDENKRDLPWRRTTDPYLIWLSEVIMQQTRIEQGRPYYEKFVDAFPDIHSLADASEKEILKLWQGLGYYSRARHLLEAAHQIKDKFNGVFPSTFDEIKSLKGVGEYSAAAISSIAFRLPYPVVDGNVLRFFSRYYGIQDPIGTAKVKNIIRKKAREAMYVGDPGRFNQAMMEFGAMHCIPVKPDCHHCIFQSDCSAHLHQRVDKIPVIVEKKNRRVRYFHYLVIRNEDGHRLLMKKREQKDIWKGMYDFPMIETGKPVSLKRLVGTPEWKTISENHPVREIRRSDVFRHLLTHQVILARFYECKADAGSFPSEKWISLHDLKTLPIPKLVENYIQTMDWLV